MRSMSVRAVEQKQALHDTLRGNRLPIKAVADVLGVSHQAVCAWGDTSVDSHIPSARIPALLAASDHPALLEYWAGLQGRAVIALPEPTVPDVCQLRALVGTFGELLETHAEGSKDGKWTAEESAALTKVATQLAALALGQAAFTARQVQR